VASLVPRSRSARPCWDGGVFALGLSRSGGLVVLVGSCFWSSVRRSWRSRGARASSDLVAFSAGGRHAQLTRIKAWARASAHGHRGGGFVRPMDGTRRMS